MDNSLLEEIKNMNNSYKIRERILSYYGNDFSREPFTYYKSISKPDLLFDYELFFEDYFPSYRFIDDFIEEILLNKVNNIPISSVKYKHKLNLNSFKNSCFGTIEIKKLIKELYKHSYSNKSSSKIVFTRTVLLNILNRNEKEICVNSLDFSFEDQDEEDEIIDIYSICPEDSLISTLKNILEFNNYSTQNMIQKVNLLISDHELNNYKYIDLNSLSNNLKDEKGLFILRSQFFNDLHINLYFFKHKNYCINNSIESSIMLEIIENLLNNKKKNLSILEDYLNFCFTKYEQLQIKIHQEYFISFCSCCLINCSFHSKILKKDNNNSEKSLKCFRLIMNYLKNRELTRFDLDLTLCSICCVFYNANFLSTIHFSEYYIKYNDDQFLSEEISYCYCDYITDQLICFLNEEINQEISYNEENDHSRFFSGLTMNELDNILVSISMESSKDCLTEVSNFLKSCTIITEKIENGNNILDSFDISTHQLNIFKENYNKLNNNEMIDIKLKLEQCKKLDEQMFFINIKNNYSEILNIVYQNVNSRRVISLNNFQSIINQQEIITTEELINKSQENSFSKYSKLISLNAFLGIKENKIRIKDCSIFNELIKKLMIFNKQEMMENYINEFIKKQN